MKLFFSIAKFFSVFRFHFMVLSYIIFVLLYFRIYAENNPFPNDQSSRIDEWDRLPPTILICVLARNKAHTLPYFLGSLEDLDYPKDRISLFIRTDHNIDDTRAILDRWVDAVGEFYHKIDYKIDQEILEGGYKNERGPFDWSPPERHNHVIKLKQEALQAAKNQWADYIIYIDCDVFFTKKRVLQALISTRQSVVSPFLTGPTNEDFSFANFEIKEENPDSSSKFDFIFQREQPDIYRVDKVKSCVLIDLLTLKSRQISFESSKNNNSAADDDLLFESLESLNLHYFLDNRLRYGWILPPMRQNLADLKFDEENLRFLLTENLNDGPRDALLYSPFVEPILPPKTKFGFDEIFLINLKRRPD
uniref:Uncharacterized protein n=1 Tax=Romanomermis culicivorax TaxID=13658 RepID=A0A915KWE6_ROMCU